MTSQGMKLAPSEVFSYAHYHRIFEALAGRYGDLQEGCGPEAVTWPVD